jgi:hypothetical protein
LNLDYEYSIIMRKDKFKWSVPVRALSTLMGLLEKLSYRGRSAFSGMSLVHVGGYDSVPHGYRHVHWD